MEIIYFPHYIQFHKSFLSSQECRSWGPKRVARGPFWADDVLFLPLTATLALPLLNFGSHCRGFCAKKALLHVSDINNTVSDLKFYLTQNGHFLAKPFITKSCAGGKRFPECVLNRHISISGCYFSYVWSVKRPTKWEETRLLFFKLQVRPRQDFLQETEMLTESAGVKTCPSVSPLTSCYTTFITSSSSKNPVSTK